MMDPIPDTPGKCSHWHFNLVVDDADNYAKQALVLGGVFWFHHMMSLMSGVFALCLIQRVLLRIYCSQ